MGKMQKSKESPEQRIIKRMTRPPSTKASTKEIIERANDSEELTVFFTALSTDANLQKLFFLNRRDLFSVGKDLPLPNVLFRHIP
jgi:hypothetical protein